MTFFERCHSWHHRFCSRSKTFTFQSVECSQRFEDRVPSDHYDEEERSSDRGFIDDDPIIDQYEGSSDLNDDHLRQQTQKSETDPTAPHKRRLYSSGENDQEAAASPPSFQRGARTRIYSSPSPPPPPNPYLDRNDFFGLNEEKPERTDESDDPPDLLPDTQRMPIWDDDDDDQEDENGDKVVVVEEEEETDLSPRYTVQQVKDLLNTQREYYQKQTSTKWKGKGQGKTEMQCHHKKRHLFFLLHQVSHLLGGKRRGHLMRRKQGTRKSRDRNHHHHRPHRLKGDNRVLKRRSVYQDLCQTTRWRLVAMTVGVVTTSSHHPSPLLREPICNLPHPCHWDPDNWSCLLLLQGPRSVAKN